MKVHASQRLFKMTPMPLPDASTNTSGRSRGLVALDSATGGGTHKEISEAFGVGNARMEGEGDQETSGGEYSGSVVAGRDGSSMRSSGWGGGGSSTSLQEWTVNNEEYELMLNKHVLVALEKTAKECKEGRHEYSYLSCLGEGQQVF